jgi:gamma-glutamyltranspeptidase / glutathione hydrolase
MHNVLSPAMWSMGEIENHRLTVIPARSGVTDEQQHVCLKQARRQCGVCIATLASLLLSACVTAPEPSAPSSVAQPAATAPAPEAASGWIDKPGWSSKKWMVAAANPLASEVGAAILKAGGSAVDAAIAVQMVLTLVEPQSSGIGGGAFLVHFDGKKVQAFDGRETAPAAARDDLFMGGNQQPLPFPAAVVGGRSVGVPGVLRMLALAHAQHGRLPWARLSEPAIRLAEDGFVISPRLARLIESDKALMLDPTARAYFYETDDRPKTAGTRLKNPALATTLRDIAEHGPKAFYQGDLALAMVNKVREHPSNPGFLALDDITNYQAKERAALCFNYRHTRICGMPPPSSGTVALAQIFGMLEAMDMVTDKPQRLPDGRWLLAPQAVHAYSEAARLAYADRALYLADPDFVDVPVQGLIAPDYLAQRRSLIKEQSMGTATAGQPEGVLISTAPDQSPEFPSTSHISVVDAWGQAVSMTTTIEDAFGSRQMVRGFLLNNQLTDFSFAPRDAVGRPVANRVQPGKRPRSSMSPLLVFDRQSGQLLMTLGSPGGSAIINYVGKVLLGTIDWGLNMQDAISLPNFGSRNGPTELEAGRIDANLAAALTARGHNVRVMEQTSGLQGITRTPSGWFGGADPRREGVAQGK